jgi:glycosyltransferase involved in cell wall biosynthesis
MRSPISGAAGFLLSAFRISALQSDLCLLVSAAISHLQSPISGDSPLDVLLVTRACTEHYPPTVNQANLLAQRGLSVGLLDLFQPGVAEAVDPLVRRWRPHSLWNSKTDSPRPFSQRLANALLFRRTYRKILASERPKVVIAYDILGSAVVPPRQVAHRSIYHFHELPEPEPGMRIGTRLALLQAKRRSRGADLVVFSDANRAECYQRTARLSKRPVVVMNCPRHMEKVPFSPLRQQLALNTQLSTLNLQPSTQLVCYVGSVGVNQGLPEAARSMRYWPEDSVFVLVGAYSRNIQDAIFASAQTTNAVSRVIFLGSKPHNEALALTAGADLGLSLIQPNSKNLVFSSGAVNKRFEYMALGVPQVTNAGPGVSELIQKTGCGICIDPNSPEAIGKAVNDLLTSPELRERMAQNSRRCHLEEFYYERQFEPVLNWIQAAVNGQ